MQEIATKLRRTERTVRNWCVNGTLRAFGFSVHQDIGNRWWIRVD